ncbi:unnamed protein product, partial [Protopolystoma xenopodis]
MTILALTWLVVLIRPRIYLSRLVYGLLALNLLIHALSDLVSQETMLGGTPLDRSGLEKTRSACTDPLNQMSAGLISRLPPSQLVRLLALLVETYQVCDTFSRRPNLRRLLQTHLHLVRPASL